MERLKVCRLSLLKICIVFFIALEGKLAIAENPAKFNQEASRKYKELLPHEKEELKKESELCVKMDARGILQEADKIFQNIQKLVSPSGQFVLLKV